MLGNVELAWPAAKIAVLVAEQEGLRPALWRNGYSKGATPKLAHELHVLAESRNNFVIGLEVTPPTGTSEGEAAERLVLDEINAGRRPDTLGADRKYSDGDALVERRMGLDVIPHFAVRDD